MKYLLLILSLSIISCNINEVNDRISNILVKNDSSTFALPAGEFSKEFSNLIKTKNFNIANIPNIQHTASTVTLNNEERTIPIDNVEKDIILNGSNGAFDTSSLSDDFVIREGVFKKGNLKIDFTYTTAMDVNISFSINGILDKNNKTLTSTINLGKSNSNQSQDTSKEFDLAGMTLKPTDNKITLTFDIKAALPANQQESNVEINGDIFFKDLDFDYIKCFLGDKEIKSPSNNLKPIDFIDLSKYENIQFLEDNTKLIIDVENSFGIPISIDLSAIKFQKKDNSLVDLIYKKNSDNTADIEPATVNSDNTITPKITRIEINYQNSNLKDLISKDTDKIIPEIKIHINKGLTVNQTNNFIKLDQLNVKAILLAQISASYSYTVNKKSN